ncbi:MAG: pyridoxal 5'-phosphate synthase glutaminase subunit PdxT [Candidatus Hadarchaeaceae archaeon]
MMKIGVVGLQGAVSEHIEAVKRALVVSGFQGEAMWIARPQQLAEVDGIIIPGGESTTIGKLMKITEIFDGVKALAESGVPILGTCAGMIVLAKRGDEQVMRTKQPLLGLIDISVVRNAFGRQRDSFEADISIPMLGEKPFRGVFIRAPAVKETWGDVEVIAEFMGKIVGVKQRNIIAVAFHPELANDTRLHEYFLMMCRSG